MNQAMLFIVSLCGYMFLLYALFRGKKSALYPALTVSAITALSLPAALAGVLASYYQTVYAGGFAAFALGALWLLKPEKRRHRQWHPRRTRTLQLSRLNQAYPLLVFAVLTLLAFPLFQDRFLYAYDDFTHWGKIAHAISVNMRLPVETDQLTLLSPPGSALFIGYASSVMGVSDGVWLYAQAVMLLAFGVSLLAIGKDLIRQGILTVLLLLFINYSITPESLYIENLLALSALSALMLCLSDDEFTSLDSALLVPLLCALVLIGNTGLLLFTLIATYAVFLILRHAEDLLPRLLPLLLVVLLPLVLLHMWHTYAVHNLSIGMSMQDMLRTYQANIAGKTIEDFVHILKMCGSFIFNPAHNHALLLIPAAIALSYSLRRLHLLHGQRHIFVICAIFFAAFELVFLLMYLVGMDMPTVLIKNGNNYDRFNKTLVPILAGFLLAAACHIHIPDAESPNRSTRMIPILLTLASAVLITGVLGASYRVIHSADTRAQEQQSACHFAQISSKLAEYPSNGSYVVLFCDEDVSNYHKYLSRYYLRSKDVALLYDYDEALALSQKEDWRTFINLHEGTIQDATETIGVELFSESYTRRYDNLLSTVGYKENTRYSASNAADIKCAQWDTTGYIPVRVGDILRLHNVIWSPTDENDARGGVMWYGRDMNYLDRSAFVSEASLAAWDPVYDEAGNIVQLTVPENISAETRYLRITAQDIRHLSVITVNEEIR